MTNETFATTRAVREFYEANGQEHFIAADDTVASLAEPVMSDERVLLKTNLIMEEAMELAGAVLGPQAESIMKEAWGRALEADEHVRDVVGASDALADLLYVQDGLVLEAGIPIAAIFAEVHRSNMSKLGEDGLPIISDGVTPAPDGEVKPAGKILKGPNWFEPDLKAIIEGREPDRTPVLQKK